MRRPQGWFRRRSPAAVAPPDESADPAGQTPTVGLLLGCVEELEQLRDRGGDDAYEQRLIDAIALAEAAVDERHALALFELYWRLARHYRRHGRVDDEYALLVWWSAQPVLPLPLTSRMAQRLAELSTR